jgi:hypothetical protein
MRKLRALAVALLSVAALTLGSTAAIAADNEPESGGVTAPPDCYNYENFFRNKHGRCRVERTFKPGRLGKDWSKVTFPYSIWVNDVREHPGELTIDGSTKPDNAGFYSKGDTVEPIGPSTPFKTCDKIEIVWDKATVTNGKGEELHTFLGQSAAYDPSKKEECSGSDEGQSVSVPLPGGGSSGPGLLAGNGTSEPATLSTGGTQPL